MTPKLSIIAASIRKSLGGLAGDIGKYADEYWNSVVLALRGNVPTQDFKTETVLNMHMDGADPDWANVVLGMHMGGGEVDPYWSNVSLLMLMNGTNGSTAIGDVTGKTVTVVGNTAISTTQSKFGGSSCYFDGTGDLLSTTGMTLAGDFTLECWVHYTTSASWYNVFQFGDESANRCSFGIQSGTVKYDIYGGALEPVLGGTLNSGTWNHVAWCRSGSTLYALVNGAYAGSTTESGTLGNANILRIGDGLLGYLDNVRITNGIARYTDTFTPPNREFPAGATTIYDVKGHPVTVAGNTAIVATQSRFGGYSCYFDGSGDYLSIPANSDFGFGTANFTVEAWIYVSGGQGTDRAITDFRSAYLTDVGTFFIDGPTNKLAFWYGTKLGATGTAITTGVWYHVALSRSAGVFNCYLNGVLDWSATATVDFGATRPLGVGGCVLPSSLGSSPFNGYIDDLRITKGVAKYTAAFTPPSRAFTHDVAFYDEKGLVPTITGAPTISTATLKYGYGSASLNGTTDYLTFDASTNFGLGTDDFTIEAWVKTSAAGTLIDFRNYANDYGHFYLATGGYLAFDHTYGAIVGTTTVTDNNWHHVAFVRYKNILTLFVDGADSGAAIANANIGSNRQARVGAKVDGTNFFAGNIDELRVTKGVARYVGEFTPQRYAFDDANNNVIWRDETGISTVTVSGNSTIYSAAYKYGNASMYFDADGDYLTVPASSNLGFGTGDFTVELWYQPSEALSGDRFLLDFRVSGGNSFMLWCSQASNANKPGYSTEAGTSFVSGGGWTNGAWHHVALVRASGAIACYVNGASVFTTTDARDFGSSQGVYVGSSTTASQGCSGFIDDLRITKGIARYVSNFTPPVRQNANYGVPALYDPYWDAVVLAMHMDGADNGTTFTDVKGSAVTAYGNAVTKTAIKKFGTASAYFDGVGDRLGLPMSSKFNIGTSDFTVDFWYYPISAVTSDRVLQTRDGDLYCGLYISHASASSLTFNSSVNGTTFDTAGITVSITQNIWNHIAFVRSSGVLKVYINGVQSGATPTVSGALYYNVTDTMIIGGQTSGRTINGYIDDLRITKGVARYTTNFQPAQYAFPETRTPVKTHLDPYYDNVVLNMHFNGPSGSTAFVDEKGKTVTAYGNAALSATQSKFGNVSVYFDGTGDYLKIPDSGDWSLGTDNFTIEVWVNITSLTSTREIITYRTSADTNNFWFIRVNTDGTVRVYAKSSGTVITDITSLYSIPISTWTHIAIVRYGGLVSILINGVVSASVTTYNTVGAWPTVSSSLSIGVADDLSNPFYGYIDDVRITKGVARYTQSFTVPALPNPDYKTAPAATDPYWKNVVLHMPMNGADLGTSFPESTGKTVTVNGNTCTKVAQYRFGGSSTYFDGTGDYLTLADDPSLEMGSSDYTIEFWVNFSALPGTGVWSGLFGRYVTGISNRCIICGLINNAGTYSLSVLVHSTGSSVPYADCTAVFTPVVGSWYHIAVVRSGTSLKTYANGAQVGSTTAIDVYNGTGPWYIGAFDTAYGTLNGYLDDLRITNGVARYTAAFTPPSLPNPTGYDPYAPNVVLHLPMETNFNDGTGKAVTVSGATISSTVKKLRAGSGYFVPASSNYLTVTNSTDFDFSASNFTIELWIYPAGQQPDVYGGYLVAKRGGGSAYVPYAVAVLQNRTVTFFGSQNGSTWGLNIATTAIVPDNAWTHVAAVRNGSSYKIYLNGVESATTTLAGNLMTNTDSVLVGQWGASSRYFNGYLSDLRITKGIARYTANFTPPREPFALA